MTTHNLPVPDKLTPDEFETLLRLAKKALRAHPDSRRALQDQKINIVPANFYSDIPTIQDMENSYEFSEKNGPYKSTNVFDDEIIADFLKKIDAFAEEFDPPRDGDVKAPSSFFWSNPAFSYSDAMSYYCVLRYLKPASVLEVGSGYSTLVALQALAKNGSGTLECIEPYPMAWLVDLKDRLILHEVPVQQLSPDFFNQRLANGDVLFIDSTHTVKAGSDCLHLYLRILPELRANVTVHAHDIYLPFPLPLKYFHQHIYWTEQYLLYALLLDNPRATVLYGSSYNTAFMRPAMDIFMRGRWPTGGASFWFNLNRRDNRQGIFVKD